MKKSSSVTFIVSAVCLLFMSCAPPMTFVVAEYKNQKFTKSHLAVKMYQPGDFFIQNADDVLDDLDTLKTGQVQEVYSAFFNRQFPRSLARNSIFRSIKFFKFEKSTENQPTTFYVGKNEPISFDLPSDGARFEIDSLYRFVLIMKPLQISRYAGSAGTWVMNAGGGGSFVGGSSPALEHYTEYVLWDNLKGKPVAYGKLSVSASVFMAMTRNTWLNALDGLAAEILRKTPFYIYRPAY